MKNDIVEGMLVRSDPYEGTGVVVRTEEVLLLGTTHKPPTTAVSVDVLWPDLTSIKQHLSHKLEIVEP